MKLLQIISLLVLAGIIFSGCTSPSSQESDTNSDLTIYTSIYPIQFAVEQIGGDSVSVKSLYPPGVDAHTYEPTSKDMTTIAKSDAFIYMGAGMEGFAQSAADALESQDLSLVELGQHEELFHVDENLEHEEDSEHEEEREEEHEEHEHEDHEEEHEEHEEHEHEDHEEEHEDHEGQVEDDGHNHGDLDPHIWLDPKRMLEMSHIIKSELITLNPEKSDLYNKNFQALKEDLLVLDEQFTETLQSKTNKEILVSHAAYGYWEERYGIEQIAINGLSSSSEPSQKELTEIIDQAEKHHLEYIIIEQNSTNNVSKIIQDQIGAQTLEIHNLSVLTDNDIDKEKDYFSIMYQNLDVLDQVTN
ncbi:metal ABC transporter solute-binding protein, Zn/Mn family [Virgibacillus byunsanensis]|uniref:Metal ABC transporter solute-binding protein, Zn/Mn family n=1 Tax=Virgibacillus byunsanensis TaxID=570945 RepID=A0ABW3LQT8_9BACI